MQKPFLPLPPTDDSAGIKACCQLLFHAHNLSGKKLFQFQNPSPDTKIFENMMSYCEDSMEIDYWDSFDAKLNTDLHSDEPAKFYARLLDCYTRFMTEESQRLVLCYEKETVSTGCEACEGSSAYATKFCLEYRGNWFCSMESFTEEWERYLKEGCVRTCPCRNAVQVTKTFTQLPDYLFATAPNQSEEFVKLCSYFAFEMANKKYKLVGAIVHDGQFYVTQLKDGGEDFWYARGHNKSEETKGGMYPQYTGTPHLLLFEASPLSTFQNDPRWTPPTIPRSNFPDVSSSTSYTPSNSTVTHATYLPNLSSVVTTCLSPISTPMYSYQSVPIPPLPQIVDKVTTLQPSYSYTASQPLLPLASISTSHPVDTSTTCHTLSSSLTSSSRPSRSSSSPSRSRSHDFFSSPSAKLSPPSSSPSSPSPSTWLSPSEQVASCCHSICALLYTAHLLQQNDLFWWPTDTLREPIVKQFKQLMTTGLDKTDWGIFFQSLCKTTEVTEASNFQDLFGRFMKFLEGLVSETTKGLLTCSDREIIVTRCKRCSKKESVEDRTMFLKYYGNDEFESSDAFSREWQRQFVKSKKCKCDKIVIQKMYFSHWPKILFVQLESSGADIINRAAKYPFKIGKKKNQVEYHLKGAIVTSGEHTTAVGMRPHGTWHEFEITGSSSVDNIERFNRDQDARILLFVRRDIEKLESTHKAPKTTHQNTRPLALHNLGNSCWVAACCQLLFCAHARSGGVLFEFANFSKLPDCVQDFGALMNTSHTGQFWRSFFRQIFMAVPGLDVGKYEQSDSGYFLEVFMNYLQSFLSEEAKLMLQCADVERLSSCTECNTYGREIDHKSCSVVRYAGCDDFGSPREFSAAWKRSFETNAPCPCRKGMVYKTNYFSHWPKFLFVRSTSDDVIITNAIQYPFTLESIHEKPTYKLLGAAIHTGTQSFGHYTAFVKHQENWFICSDSIFSKVEQYHEDDGTVQLMLFEKVED